MFDRVAQSYTITEQAITAILNDEANPLYQVSKLIAAFDGQAKVLDIGAGNGLLSMVVKRQSANVIIDGIEPSAFAAEIAVKWYRNFYQGYAQDFFDVIAREHYDFIVLADVIEHIEDPLSFIQALSQQIGSTTKIIISVPNVAFGAVRASLMRGEFQYVDSGILERTHLRFFTLATLTEFINKTGLNTVATYFLCRNMLYSEIPFQFGIKNLFNFLMLNRDTLAHVYQFMVVLSKDTQENSTHLVKVGKCNEPSMMDVMRRFFFVNENLK